MSKTCIGLVSSFDMASKFFDSLDPQALSLLKKYWPAPLSVVAQASKKAPRSMVREDGSISLRFPKLLSEHKWLYEVINEIGFPLPTTSINESGEPAVTSWKDAKKFSDANEKVINLLDPYEVSSSSPSTIVRIKGAKFEVLRQGKLVIDEKDIEVNS